VFDARVEDILKRGAFDEFLTMDPRMVEEAGQCGLRSFILLDGMLDGKPASFRVHSYEGPFGVGYCTAMGEF
jgi:aromatic ring-opening dioxygenase LigB subunit